MKTAFPLSAIVGQNKTRLALILNAIDPLIGGVLVYGRRGTGKSTMVRALTHLLPEISGVADCPYFCDPTAPHAMCFTCQQRLQCGEQLPITRRQVSLVTLPLNASEDRVAGSIDFAATLSSGSYHFEPGLLAAANRSILYVDEINLLNDSVADLLLDAAAMGVHRLERDGISLAHPSRFVLIGTMNPEEGMLRPQLLDRIGLYVEAEDLRSMPERIEVVERRLAYDHDPAAFIRAWQEQEETLAGNIEQARNLLPQVKVSRYLRQVVAHLVARELHAEGHRGDIVVLRAARAIAAWEGRLEVKVSDVEQALSLAMQHRARPGSNLAQQLARTLEQVPEGAADSDRPEESGIIDDDLEERTNQREGPAGLSRPLRGENDLTQVQHVISILRDRLVRKEGGRRFISLTARHSGRSMRTRQARPVTDVAFTATIRAAAPHQPSRGRIAGGKMELRIHDLRQKIRERKTRSLLIFIVDGSDSVMARRYMPQTKRVLLAMLQHAYEKRDRVAMLVFRFAQGRLVLPPTRNFTRARRCVDELYVGGCTPLATGLLEGLRLAEAERMRDPAIKPFLIVLTDGIANIDLSGNMRSITPQRDALSVARGIASRRIPAVLIDTNPHAASFTEELAPAKELALALEADYYLLGSPGASNIHSPLLQRG
jgi:magnesium chelatase subunit D